MNAASDLDHKKIPQAAPTPKAGQAADAGGRYLAFTRAITKLRKGRRCEVGQVGRVADEPCQPAATFLNIRTQCSPRGSRGGVGVEAMIPGAGVPS